MPSTDSSTNSDPGAAAIGIGCLIALILQIYSYVIFARLLLSWFPNPPEGLRPVYRFLFEITEPPLRLVRGLIPPIRIGMMALDLSPILIFVGLQLIGSALC